MSLLKPAHALVIFLCFAAYPATAGPIVSCTGVCGFAFGTSYTLNGNSVELSASGGLGNVGNLSGVQTFNVFLPLYTDGPVRPGLAILFVDIEADGCCSGSFRGTASADGYSVSGCFNGLECRIGNGTLTFPFTLGVGFNLILNGIASAVPSGGCQCSGEGYVEEIDLSLSELNGQPVTISEAPEPRFTAVAGLLAFGILGFFKKRSAC